MKDMASIAKELNELKEMLQQVLPKVALTTAPVALSEAAAACGVKKPWLLERVQRQEIPAFRPTSDSPWRVYVADVVAFLKSETNIEPVRRQPRLARRAA